MNLTAANEMNAASAPTRCKLSSWLPLLILPAAPFVASLVLSQGWFFPQCLLRKFTGIPCPTCGSTRSLAAWAHLDLEQALLFNPLFFLVCVALMIWFTARGVELLLHRTFLPNLRLAFRGWPLWKIGGVLLLLNWLYLCLTLPN